MAQLVTMEKPPHVPTYSYRVLQLQLVDGECTSTIDITDILAATARDREDKIAELIREREAVSNPTNASLIAQVEKNGERIAVLTEEKESWRKMARAANRRLDQILTIASPEQD